MFVEILYLANLIHLSTSCFAPAGRKDIWTWKSVCYSNKNASLCNYSLIYEISYKTMAAKCYCMLLNCHFYSIEQRGYDFNRHACWPIEVLFIVDKHASPVHIAADLLSQAEHGPDSQVVLVVAGEGVIINGIEDEIRKQCDSLPRGDYASEKIANDLFDGHHSFTQRQLFRTVIHRWSNKLTIARGTRGAPEARRTNTTTPRGVEDLAATYREDYVTTNE